MVISPIRTSPISLWWCFIVILHVLRKLFLNQLVETDLMVRLPAAVFTKNSEFGVP